MTTELDALPESVREAWRKMRYASDLTKGTVLASTSDVETIFRDHIGQAAHAQELEVEESRLHKVACEQLRRAQHAESRVQELEREKIALIAERDHAGMLQRRAESELAALKKRIAEAQTQVYGRDDWHEPLIGKRVAMLPLDDEAKG